MIQTQRVQFFLNFFTLIPATFDQPNSSASVDTSEIIVMI